VEDEQEDMDQISGKEGLLSSNAGSSPLLTSGRMRYEILGGLLDTYPVQ
jgi:hypothetical protein